MKVAHIMASRFANDDTFSGKIEEVVDELSSNYIEAEMDYPLNSE